MKKIANLFLILLLIMFFSLYFSRYTNYQESKTILTDQAIKQFENDLKSGKEINPNNYIEKEKNYNNKASRIGRKTSKLIETGFSKSLKYIMKYVENLDN